MAVAMLQMAEMFTKEIYDQVSEKMFGHTDMRPEEAPEGLILHSAGQGDRGWYVYDIWESQEAFERFSDEKLMPAIKEVMGDVQPEPDAAPQFYDASQFAALFYGAERGAVVASLRLALSARRCSSFRWCRQPRDRMEESPRAPAAKVLPQSTLRVPRL